MAAKSNEMTKLFPTRHDLPGDERAAVIDLLNRNLFHLMDLHSQTKYAHWNVKGLSFVGVHKLLDELAEQLDGEIDEIAERATALGGVARGTVRTAADGSALAEFPADTFDIPAVLAALADRYAAAAKAAREAIDEADQHADADTADLLTGTSRKLDKALWMLEAHLQK
jgi:starvation-inducible DNA-binding protein